MQAVLRIDTLADDALDAAAQFYADYVPDARGLLGGEAETLAVILPIAPHDHNAWRRAAAQDLARESAPKRVNILAGSDEGALAASLDFLENAPGVTGQFLMVDGAA